MSKHALSRIYEKYVALMRLEDYAQISLFPNLPEEERNKALGSIYTPQYIARFMVRYIRDQLPPPVFKKLTSADISCGSGIFLRTLLELQCTNDELTTDLVEETFKQFLAIDVDENACQATRLSLSLLHLVLSAKLPDELKVIYSEMIDYFKLHPELKESVGAVIGNPPFVALSLQTEEIRRRLTDFMRDNSSGRTDLYLAFLRIAMEMVTPGGFVALVLPHSFLLNKSAAKLRNELSEHFWIRCLADLSAIRVFEKTSTYIILLIAQKKIGKGVPIPNATIVKCQEFVGQALQDCLDGKMVQGKLYSIFQSGQRLFEQNEWILLPPTQENIKQKLSKFPKLEEFLYIHEGIISGADSVFIVQKQNIPSGEELIYLPFLPDREMERYILSKSNAYYLFYPSIDGRKIAANEIEQKFPQTWAYLQKNRSILEKRSSVRQGQIEWWQLTRPRSFEKLRIGKPKLISPHLILVSRFSLDMNGEYTISRAPLLYPKADASQDDLLKFFLGILNSSVVNWHLSSHAYHYRHGYVMLDPASLKRIPVPNPSKVNPKSLKQLINLVERRLSVVNDPKIEQDIDLLVLDLYELSVDERKEIGGIN